MTKPKTVAIYARVSTDSQTTENQLQELRAVSERMGWVIVGEYVDQAISGSKGREQRPAFDSILKGASRKEFDIVAAWSVDRLGRSLKDLLGFLGDIQANGVDLYLHQQGINTATPSGKALFQMCGVFAEFERGMIQERVKAGLARTKAKGTVLGRPRVSAEIEQKILDLRISNPKLGMIKIAKEVGVGVGTVQRLLA
jgi:DNA invertase Pin-like site-specific DNA recombinase